MCTCGKYSCPLCGGFKDLELMKKYATKDAEASLGLWHEVGYTMADSLNLETEKTKTTQEPSVKKSYGKVNAQVRAWAIAHKVGMHAAYDLLGLEALGYPLNPYAKSGIVPKKHTPGVTHWDDLAFDAVEACATKSSSGYACSLCMETEAKVMKAGYKEKVASKTEVFDKMKKQLKADSEAQLAKAAEAWPYQVPGSGTYASGGVVSGHWNKPTNKSSIEVSSTKLFIETADGVKIYLGPGAKTTVVNEEHDPEIYAYDPIAKVTAKPNDYTVTVKVPQTIGHFDAIVASSMKSVQGLSTFGYSKDPKPGYTDDYVESLQKKIQALEMQNAFLKANTPLTTPEPVNIDSFNVVLDKGDQMVISAQDKCEILLKQPKKARHTVMKHA